MDVDTYEGLTLGPSSQTEGGERTYGAKDVVGEYGRDLASLYVRTQQLETGPPRDNNFLLTSAREVADDGMGDRRRGLQRQVVEMHGVGRSAADGDAAFAFDSLKAKMLTRSTLSHERKLRENTQKWVQ